MSRRILLLAAVAVAAAAYGLTQLLGSSEVDWEAPPSILYETDSLDVGDHYTVGSIAIPSEVARPVRLVGVELVRTSGVEMAGAGALVPSGPGVGLVHGWPPTEPSIEDANATEREWLGEVAILVGIEITEPISGFRGIRVRWTDAQGAAGGVVFDIAAVTCAPDACANLDPEVLAVDLGLRH